MGPNVAVRVGIPVFSPDFPCPPATQFTEAKHYHAKLVSIRRDMLLLHEKTARLKVGAAGVCGGGVLLRCLLL